MKFIYTLMEMPGHDLEVEADDFRIEAGGALVFYNIENGREVIIRAINARVWRVCEAA